MGEEISRRGYFYIRRERRSTVDSSQFRVPDCWAGYLHQPSKTFYCLKWELNSKSLKLFGVVFDLHYTCATRIVPHSANS